MSYGTLGCSKHFWIKAVLPEENPKFSKLFDCAPELREIEVRLFLPHGPPSFVPASVIVRSLQALNGCVYLTSPLRRINSELSFITVRARGE